MANTIKLKRGTSAPSTSDISSGEVAIDTSAQKLYVNDSGTVKEIGGGTTVGGATGVDFNDNVKIRSGTGNDLEIFHDGTDSKISSSEGELNITHTGNGVMKLYRQGNVGIQIDGNGWVTPHATNTLHLGYSSYRWNKIWGKDASLSGTLGVDVVEWSSQARGNDDCPIYLGTNNDLKIHHNGSASILETGWSGQTQTLPVHIKGEPIELHHSGSKKAETVSGGFTVTGTCTATSFSGDGSNLTGVSAGVSSDAQYNTVAGTDAGSSFSGTSAEKNTLYGYHAGAAMSTGDENTIVGYKAGEDITTGGTNTIVGNYSGERLTTHGNNTFFGHMSGSENTGESNIAVGSYALKDSGSGTHNIAVGNGSLNYNSNGTFNIGIGQRAVEGVYGQNKDYNIGIGRDALQKSKADYNIGIGRSAGANGQNTGSYNISIGNYSGYALTSGQENTLLGEYAGNSLTTGSNNLVLGHEAEPSAATVSNEVTLGNASITKLRIPGLNNFEISDGGVFSGVTSTANATPGVRKITTSTSAPSGGSDGDIWVKYTN